MKFILRVGKLPKMDVNYDEQENFDLQIFVIYKSHIT